MATGSVKAFTAVNVAYRLLKSGGARRILFLVDQSDLGRKAGDELAIRQLYSPRRPAQLPDAHCRPAPDSQCGQSGHKRLHVQLTALARESQSNSLLSKNPMISP